MNSKVEKYIKLERLFAAFGYHLYLVGGTVRDILLSRPLDDMDLVTDCLPLKCKEILSELKVDDTFIRFGYLKVTFENIKFDITTLREEKGYLDNRHPNEVVFTNSLEIDHKRRDFTINSMYMDKDMYLFDFENGKDDIKNKVIRTVGEPNARLLEDPLRILRAIRFSYVLGFTISDDLRVAIIKNIDLLKKLNPQKIKEEILKFKCNENSKLFELFSSFNIEYLLSVIK